MAALLHDIDEWKINPQDHQAAEFLKSHGVPSEKIQQISDTIIAADFGVTGEHPNFATPEQAVLFDADKLDAIGSIGICRTIMFGQSKNKKLFDPEIFPTKNQTRAEYTNLARSNYTTINHFFDKLLVVPYIMQTEYGKKEAMKRQKIMVEFLTEFFREQGQDAWITYMNQYLKDKQQTLNPGIPLDKNNLFYSR